ncbi:MAG: hemin uptake protein HemP [Rhodobacteraceae bacterium]|nr:hemin uptake protein HemP [Paracoccaceae bacterium]
MVAPTLPGGATHLTTGDNLVRITLNGKIYSRHITRQGKRILTK